MSLSLMEHEAMIRVLAFGSVFAVLAMWELAAPKRFLRVSKPRRWFTNWMIVILDTLVVRILFPAAAVGAAWDAQRSEWGIFNHWNAPIWLEVILAMLLLDLLIYGQHVASHKIPVLWRIHRVHHVDRDMDVTTAIRFHPIEIALSMVLKIGAVYILGASAIAVILFEIILNGSAMFNHANITIPRRIDRFLRWVLVTPDMHRVHHSVHRAEDGRELRIQPAMVGPDLRHLRGPAPRRSFRDDHRPQQLPGRTANETGLVAVPSLSEPTPLIIRFSRVCQRFAEHGF